MSYQKRSNILQELQQAIKKKVGDKSKTRQQASKLLQSSVQKKKRQSKQPTRQNRISSSIKGKQITNFAQTNQKNYDNTISKPVSLFNNQNLYGVDLKSAKGKKFTNRKWDKILSLINYMVSSSQKAIKYINSSNFQAQFAVKLYKSDKQNLQNELKSFDFEDMLSDFKNPQKSSRANQQNVNQIYQQNIKLKKQIVLLQKEAERFQTYQSYVPTQLTVQNEEDHILKKQLKKIEECLNKLITENGFKKLKETIQKQIKFQKMYQKSKGNTKKTQQIDQILQSLEGQKTQILLLNLKQISGSSQIKSQNNTNRSHKLKQVQQQKQNLQKQIGTLKEKLQQIRNIQKIQKQNDMLKKNHSVLYTNLIQIIKQVDDRSIELNEEYDSQFLKHDSHILDCIKNHLKNNKQLLYQKQQQVSQISHKMQKEYLKLKHQSERIGIQYQQEIKKYQNEMYTLNKNIDRLERQVQNDQNIITNLQENLQAQKIQKNSQNQIQVLQSLKSYQLQAQRLFNLLQKQTQQNQKLNHQVCQQRQQYCEIQKRLKLRQQERQYFFNQKQQTERLQQDLLTKLGQQQQKLQNKLYQLSVQKKNNKQLTIIKESSQIQKNSLKEQITQLLQRVLSSEERQSNQTEELLTLQQERQNLQAISNKNQQIQSQMHYLKSKIQKLQQQLNQSLFQAKTFQDQNQLLRNSIYNIKCEYQDMKKSLQTSQNKLTLLENQLGDKKMFLKKLQSKIIQKQEQKNQIIKENQSILNERYEQIQNLSKICQKITTENNVFSSLIKEQQNKITQLQDQLKYSEQNHVQLSRADFQFKLKLQNYQSEVCSLKSKNSQLKQQSEKYEQSQKKDKLALSTLNQQLQESISIIEEMKQGFQSQKIRFSQQICSLQQILSQKQNILIKLQEELQKNKTKNIQITEDLQKQKMRNQNQSNLAEDMQRLQEQNKKTKLEEQVLKKQLKNLKDQLEQRQSIIIELKNINQIRQHQTKAKNKQVTRLEAELHLVNTQNNQLKINKQKISHDKQKISHDFMKVKSQLQTYLSQKIDQNQNKQELHRLAKQIQHLQKEHQSNQDKIRKLNQHVSTQKHLNQTMKRLVQTEKAKRNQDTEQIQLLSQQITTLKSQLQSAVSQLAQVKAQLSTSREENIEEISKNVIIEKQINRLQDEIQSKNVQMSTSLSEIYQLKEKIEYFQERMQLFGMQKFELQNSKQALDVLKNQNEQNLQKIHKLEKQSNEKDDKLKMIQNQLKNIQEDKQRSQKSSCTISSMKQKQYLYLIKQILKGVSIQTEDLNSQTNIQVILATASQRVVQLRKKLREQESNRKKIEKHQENIKFKNQNDFPINQFGTQEQLDSSNQNQGLVSPIRLFEDKNYQDSRDLKASQLIIDMRKQKQDKQEEDFHCSMISQIPHLEQECTTDRKDRQFLNEFNLKNTNQFLNSSNQVGNISDFNDIQQDKMNNSVFSDTNLAESISEAGSSPRKQQQKQAKIQEQQNLDQQQPGKQDIHNLSEFNDLKSENLENSFVSQIKQANISRQQHDLDYFGDYKQEMNSPMMSEKQLNIQEQKESEPQNKIQVDLHNNPLQQNLQKEVEPTKQENCLNDFKDVTQNINSSMMSNKSKQSDSGKISPSKGSNRMLEQFDDYKSQNMASSMLSENPVKTQQTKAQNQEELVDFEDYKPDNMNQSMLSENGQVEVKNQDAKQIDGLSGFEDYQQNGLNDSILSQKMDTDNVSQSRKDKK